MKNNSFLFINYYFPPIQSAGVYRNYHFAKALLKQGSSKHLFLTTANFGLFNNSDEFNTDNYSIHRLKTKDYRSILSRNKVTINGANKTSFLKTNLIKLINTSPINRWIGEGGYHYIQKGIEKGRQFLSDHPNAIIVSSFRPYADHYIAYQLKKQFSKTKWVADFRDLHLEPIYNDILFPQRQERINRKMLSQADLITTVSNGLGEHLKKYKRPLFMMRNGFHKSTISSIKKYPNFTLSYTGSLFRNERDPSVLFSWLRTKIDSNQILKDQISIIYAGKDGKKFKSFIERYNLSDIFINKGIVSRQESKEIQQASHINILLTSNASNHYGVITSKFYEYVASGVPVCTIIKGQFDPEFEHIFKQNEIGVILYNSLSNEESFNWILNQYQLYTRKEEPKQTQFDALLSVCDWDTNALKILNILNA